MESFVVSARKYRPATFDTVIGQTAITSTLKNAIRQQQLAQAFLFCGPRGVGKTTCARILAKTINCQNITDNIEPCNQCDSCLHFNTNASFNIFELDAASNNSVEDIRSLIDQVRIPPQAGKYKVYIIDEVHMLSQAAFNAFLKTLEEPPAYAKFILATTEKHKVLPTILSRCQIFDFRRISVEDMIRQLRYVASQQNIAAEDDALHIIAQKADGAMRDALSIFDQIVSFSGKTVTYANVIENLNVLDYDYFFRLTDTILVKDHSSSLLITNEIIERGFDGQHFLSGYATHLRNLLVGQDEATIRLLEVSDTIRGRYQEQAKRCSPAFLMKALEMCNQYDLNYRISNNKRLHLEILIVLLCGLTGNSGSSTQPSPARVEVQKKTPDLNIEISIKSIEKELTLAAQENTEEADPAGGKQDHFDQSMLEEAWDAYARPFCSDSPSFYSTLTKRKPELKEGHVIRFLVDNKVQEDLMNARQAEVVNHLKRLLLHSLITLKIEITESVKEDKPYTSVDKFKKIAGNNPAIHYLKEELDLDLEL
ncbi:MAG: DNA polymerase III subunit gamma/tau [Bacteroidetes bacterium]|nr:DNA polymerase III subunit gamma/tau [Bacteroidota bacterium]